MFQKPTIMWKNSVLFAMMCCCQLSCKQQRFDLKPRSALVVPTSAADYQALLNNTGIMNVVPSIGEAGADDYYLDDAYVMSLVEFQRNLYTWQADVFGASSNADWNSAYQAVLYTNTVMDGLPGEPHIYAQALFHRAHLFYQLLQLFAAPYQAKSASASPGIPLRLHATVDEPSFRYSIAAGYTQIITDLMKCIPWLEVRVPYASRPSKAAAYALLARSYLQQADYPRAYLYADSCLQLQPQLLDYHELDGQAAFPFSRFNAEVIFHATLFNSALISPNNARVTNEVYGLYADSDLRKDLFFKTNTNGSVAFKGNYDGGNVPLFAGITTAELYLIRAECQARLGNTEQALADLNALLEKRIQPDLFVPVTASTSTAALDLILTERRRELLFRGQRWSDLRRLNKEPERAVTLNRSVNGAAYKLEPGSVRYTYPIPPDVMVLNPDMPQNNR